MSDSSDDDINALKEQVANLTETMSGVSQAVAGLQDAQHEDSDHLVAAVGAADELKTQVTDLQTKLTEIELQQKAILDYLQQLAQWWQGQVTLAVMQTPIVLPPMPTPPST